MLTGKSCLSTSISTEAIIRSLPDSGVPPTVSIYLPKSISFGMGTESSPGSGEIIPANPIGSRPIRATSGNKAGVGEVTVTVSVWPGFTMLPAEGSVIWSTGLACGTAAIVAGRRIVRAIPAKTTHTPFSLASIPSQSIALPQLVS